MISDEEKLAQSILDEIGKDVESLCNVKNNSIFDDGYQNNETFKEMQKRANDLSEISSQIQLERQEEQELLDSMTESQKLEYLKQKALKVKDFVTKEGQRVVLAQTDDGEV